MLSLATDMQSSALEICPLPGRESNTLNVNRVFPDLKYRLFSELDLHDYDEASTSRQMRPYTLDILKMAK